MDNAKKETAVNRGSQLGDISYTSFSLASIKIEEGSVNELEQILTLRVDNAHGAYTNAPVVLNIESLKDLNSLDYFLLKDVCKRHNLYLIGITGVTTEQQAQILSKRMIPIVNSLKHKRLREENVKPKIVTQLVEVKVPVPVKVPYEVQVPYEVKTPVPIKVVRRNVRSGETVIGRDSSLSIYGSVGMHAKIMASQHVYIFGNVKGADIFAGALKSAEDPGFGEAVIQVHGDFYPGLISIAGIYRTAEDLDSDQLLKETLAKKNGLVITLENQNLKYYTISEFSKK